MKPPDPTPVMPPGWIASHIQRLVNHQEISEELYQAVLRVARDEMSNDFKNSQLKEAEDLAGEFILHVADNRIRSIHTLSVLRVEYRKFLISTGERRDRHEIWRQSSESLTKLARTGAIHRLDADLEQKNSRHSVYAWQRDYPPGVVATPQELEALHIEPLKNLKRRGRDVKCRSAGEEKKEYIPSMLTASEAEELLLEILRKAQKPCRLNDLFNLICEKLELLDLVPLPPLDEPFECRYASQNQEHEQWFDFIAERKAKECAKWIQSIEDGPAIFFDYLIRGRFFGEDVELSYYGDTKRVWDRKKELTNGLQAILPECFDPDADPGHSGKLFCGILMRLAKHFPDRAGLLSSLPIAH